MPPVATIPKDFADRIKRLRMRHGWTQTDLAEKIGASYVTVCRWETEQSKPRQMAWNSLLELEGNTAPQKPDATPQELPLDFQGAADAFLAVAEAERLSFGHQANPFFATETSRIDPLPHQKLAVYEHMLAQPRLRFLLADDAGAGKTIMAGLYIREMLSRRRIRRILVIPPAGLVGNWQSELRKLFGLDFTILEGADFRNENPLIQTHQAVVSVDTLRQPQAMLRLASPETPPYDLVIFDEAHKLSASRDEDFRERKTDRYRLAEALAGSPGAAPGWQLPWAAQHLMLLTATPHMGKPYPYFALWRLLLPTTITTPEALDAFPADKRHAHFIRRTKEEMVTLDGKPLYATRVCQTLSYALSQGDVSEQELYDLTTEYLRTVYNKAKVLNRSAARMVVSVFQRRLASSTYALSCSLQRRLDKIDAMRERFLRGDHQADEFHTWIMKQERDAEKNSDGDAYDTTTADELDDADLEKAEGSLLDLFVADSLTDLNIERQTVAGLLDLAQRVMAKGEETKFTRLREVLTDPAHANEKLLIFTEHRDTLAFLRQRMEQIGHAGRLAQIHGGMHHTERQAELDRFRQPEEEGGARIMICTDAAGEGLNMQFCGRMVNYDIPWNPARLEQRMGRIHRYGQKRPLVVIFNLIAGGAEDGGQNGTREGKVLCTLLKKLEEIRKAMGHEKVFDSIGRIMADVSLKTYMDRLYEPGASADDIASELGGTLTAEQVSALEAQERHIYGDGGEVQRALPRLAKEAQAEIARRLMPGFVRLFMDQSAAPLGLRVVGEREFTLETARSNALDSLLPLLEELGGGVGAPSLSCERPPKTPPIWVHPGEVFFDAYCQHVRRTLGDGARRGSLLVDPEVSEPYMLHLGRIEIVRQAAPPEYPELGQREALETRLVAVRQTGPQAVEAVAPERILCLHPRRTHDGGPLSHDAQRMLGQADALRGQAEAFLREKARNLAKEQAQSAMERAASALEWVGKGFDAQRLELAQARVQLRPKAAKGDKGAILELDRIAKEQLSLPGRRSHAEALLKLEPSLIAPGETIQWIGHALVLPSQDPTNLEKLLQSSEIIAQTIAISRLEAMGAKVTEVHTPDRARRAGLSDSPGFDLLAVLPDGRQIGVEVKGRMGTGDVEMSMNEWGHAVNMGDAYWLMVVFECASPSPRVCRVVNPFKRLLARRKGSVVIGAGEIFGADEGGEI